MPKYAAGNPPVIRVRRRTTGILATTDFHSHLERAGSLVLNLGELRRSNVIADCGDFFEGTEYYPLGGGAIERELLQRHYDLLLPGNHGFLEYQVPELARKTICTNLTTKDGRRPFARAATFADPYGRIGILGILGQEAFEAIPVYERANFEIEEPQAAIQRQMARMPAIEAWILLSHSGVAQDMELVSRLDDRVRVVFAGHCHSSLPAPRRVGSTILGKAFEYGTGYVHASRTDQTWKVLQHEISAQADGVPTVHSGLAELRRIGAEHVGWLREEFRERSIDVGVIAGRSADEISRLYPQAIAVLNETALRERELGRELSRSDLMGVEPFANELVAVEAPPAIFASFILEIRRRSMRPAVAMLGHPSRLITTKYLAENLLPQAEREELGIPLRSVVSNVLTGGSDDPHRY